MEKMSSSTPVKNEKILIKCAQNEMKTVGVTDYTNQTLPTHYGWKKCLSPTPVKMRKYLSNVHKIEGAHLQYVNSHYAKFE